MSRAFRLGVFIVSTLAILAAGVFLIGQRQFLFSSTYQLKTTFKNVTGLNEGAEVRIGGIPKGTVKQIELPAQPDGEMTVVMALESSTHAVLRTDSVASIKTEGLLGNQYVEISFGSGNAPQVDDGGTIASEPPLEMSDLMKKTSEILDNVQNVSSKIDQGVGTMGALVNDKKVYERLNETTAQATKGAAAFQENMEALRHNFFLRGFFSKRGYEDSSKLGQYDIAKLPQGTSLKKFDYDGGKIFADVDTAKLKGEKALAEAGQFLEANPFGMAVVVASSGMKGDAEEARTLTQARAMVVRDYLVNTFRMDDTRVRTMGLGKTGQAPSDAGRVEVIIYPPESGATPAKGARHP
jgi:phospholipid/cholesterol/gamma-HCH transport system substrate-binding protein